MGDRRDMYWHLDGATDESANEVHFSKSRDNLVRLVAAEFDYDADDIDSADYYSDPIYTNRHLPKYVYRGAEFTMICVDTQIDGNKFLAIYDNSKEVKQ